MTEIIRPIPARIKNIADDGHVAGTEDIIDDTKGKTQQEINTSVEETIGSDDTEGTILGRIKALEEASPSTGSVNKIKVGDTEYLPSSGVVSLPAYPATLPASDVYAWAKEASKPSYTKSEVGLSEVGNYKAVSTVASQGLSDTEKSNARTNIGAGTSSFSGSYDDLTDKPTTLAGYGITDANTRDEANSKFLKLRAYTSLEASSSNLVDLNNITEAGTYRQNDDLSTQYVSNKPTSDIYTFKLIVEYARPSNTWIRQRFQYYNSENIYERRSHDSGGTWTNWCLVQANLANYASTSEATQSEKGLMSAADKTKLDGVTTGATTYTFATGDSDGQIKVTPNGGSAQNVNVKGLAALAYKASLDASDIPNLNWSKITSGKPTTISGYGITDAYTKDASDLRFMRISGYTTLGASESNIVDLNNIVTYGVYRHSSGNQEYVSNKPSDCTGIFRLIVERSALDTNPYIRQIYQEHNSPVVYERYTANTGTSWNSWAKVQDDLLNYVHVSGINVNIQNRATSSSHYSLNSLTTPNVYGITNNNNSLYFEDRPVTDKIAFRVEVRQTRDLAANLMQRYQQSGSQKVYERYSSDTGSSWGSWYLVQDNLENYPYTSSDRSKKKNIEQFSEHISRFTMKETGEDAYGVIAQNVQEMFRHGEDGNYTVNYPSILSYYVGILENKVQKLEEEVRELKKQVGK